MIFRFCSAAKRTRCRSGFILADWARSYLTSALIGVEVGDWDADSYSDRGTGTKGLLPIGAETIIELSCSQANPRNAARTAAPTLSYCHWCLVSGAAGLIRAGRAGNHRHFQIAMPTHSLTLFLTVTRTCGGPMYKPRFLGPGYNEEGNRWSVSRER